MRSRMRASTRRAGEPPLGQAVVAVAILMLAMLALSYARTARWKFLRSRDALAKGVIAYGPYNVSPNVTLMKTPICSRVTAPVGQ